jgi:predicted AlkP superfamily pyrophosphatase or phosphodiesterase
MNTSTTPLIVLNCVGLTSRLLSHAPRLAALARLGSIFPLREVLPAVTSTVQASILTGKSPEGHGIVANGWLFRDTREVRFWQQANSVLEAEPIYATLRRERARMNRPFKAAKLFWWFNQGADVDISLTPKPHYGCDGSKAFDIHGTPAGLSESIKRELGPFPFPTFWGPMAGKGCTEWIADSAALILENERPDLTLVYLPHLDYDPQRYGPSGCDMPAKARELDDACQRLLDTAQRVGARVWIVSEYGHTDVDQPVLLNKILRQSGLLDVRRGPFGEMLDTFTSRAFAVCDHQIAHVYVRNREDIARVRELLASASGIAGAYVGNERAEIGLNHPRSGEIVLLSEPKSWFAYPYWLDDQAAPDFARTVDIHRKPGFDPCEMFFDPTLSFPKLRVARKLAAKMLGFRMKLDVIPLDPTIVRGSHGLLAADPIDRPILVTDRPSDARKDLCVTDVYQLLLDELR